MGDLISRNAVLKHIEKIRQGVQMMDDTRRASIIMNGMYLCEKAVRNQPSAQPTQGIIHCKDCKYSIDEYNDGDCYCKRPSRELVWIGKSWDFFCKAGDKRGCEADDQ